MPSFSDRIAKLIDDVQEIASKQASVVLEDASSRWKTFKDDLQRL